LNRRNHVVTLVVVALVVVGALSYLLIGGARPQLGLDLRGGISAIYSPELQEGEEPPEDFDAVLDQTIEIIRSRIDALGVAEPEISRQGNDVLVQLPGVTDAERAQEVIGTTAQLNFRKVEAVVGPGEEGYDETPACTEEQPKLPEGESGLLCEAEPSAGAAQDGENTGEEQYLKYRVGEALLTGDRIERAFASIGQGGWEVALEFDGEGADVFADVTSELACERDQGQLGLFAIVLDDRVESAPGVQTTVACGQGITGGQASITVGGGQSQQGQLGTDPDEQEARDLALVLQTGALPITLEPSTFQTVSPTLGAASLQAGLIAAVIGLVLVGAWLTLFYRTLGLVAIGGLTIFGVTIAGIIALLGQIGFTLTLAGIAGIVVSIGITADSSILFFERIKDEATLGKTMRTAVKSAYDSAFRTNLAGNTVTLSAAIILYFLAVGPVRGFALTLGLSTVLDIVILATYTRSTVGLLGASGQLTKRSVRAELSAETGGAR
jgi:preprotein translocase subunit SecD